MIESLYMHITAYVHICTQKKLQPHFMRPESFKMSMCVLKDLRYRLASLFVVLISTILISTITINIIINFMTIVIFVIIVHS